MEKKHISNNKPRGHSVACLPGPVSPVEPKYNIGNIYVIKYLNSYRKMFNSV